MIKKSTIFNTLPLNTKGLTDLTDPTDQQWQSSLSENQFYDFAMNWVVYNEIMGVNTTMLNPRGNATRAEAVTMLYRVVEIFDIPAP